ncbi:MAG TPA: prephenate dehydrogenase [Clostridiales bacterium]|nr:prephenate dehydrogenase [Clostridiales bacterium]
MVTDNQYCGNPKDIETAGVIGLGLIGGSLAKALKRRAHLRVVGLDRKAAVIQAALDDAVLDAGAILPDLAADPAGRQAEAWQLLSDCRVVFICTPAVTVPALAEQAARFCPGLITDAASVKQPIMEKISCPRFIGGHPMAGSEKQGYGHSSETLLENAVYVLCLQPDSDLPVRDVRYLEDLVRRIGATPLQLGASEHDRAVATVSHLPHVAAAALSLLAARTDQGSLARLAAGGFRDITRIASSDAALWAGISLESARELLPILDQYLSVIGDFRFALAAGDQLALQRFFFQAAQYRNSLPVDGRGALAAHSSLTVYVSDHPGVLGHITTLLGEKGINISNIRIRELRTYEGGCLQLLLPDSAQAVRAAWLLKEAGYECD